MQNNKSPYYIEEDKINLRELFVTISRYKWSIIFFTTLITLAIAAKVYFMPKYYKSTVTIEVKPEDNKELETWKDWENITIVGLDINWFAKKPTEEQDVAKLPSRDSLVELWLIWNNKDEKNPTKVTIVDTSTEDFWISFASSVWGFLLIILVVVFLLSRVAGGWNSPMNFIKSKAKRYDPDKDNKITFKDVAGSEEEKEDLSEVVDFLKNPKKYKKLGAKIPKWMLLVWPPGTGKTLLSRAVAWESNVPFFSISWSEFVEMFVWVWASRVRDLFKEARENSPSIIFIDEIDAIWKKRSPWMWGWHDEREQTLNQILTEMDWFDTDTNVIVMAATNRADVLDSALLRPWRFDRKVTINLPNLIDRQKILEVHIKWKPFAENFDIADTARLTSGMSWADLANILNEAAILTWRYNKDEITNKIVRESIEKILMWNKKKSQVLTPKELNITAYHEVWHAIVWKMLPNPDPVNKISIIPRWWALWVTWFLPEKDRILVSKAKFRDELAVLFGWRCAEEIFFWKDNVTTWASNDIERATEIARWMVTRYWFDEDLWAENFAGEQVRWNYLWAEWQGKIISDKTQELIDAKVRDLLKEWYAIAKSIILDNKDLHKRITLKLLETEELTKIEFDKFFEGVEWVPEKIEY